MKSEFYKMEFEAWDEGTFDLTLEQEAAYLRLCHQMYRRHDSVPNSKKLLCFIWRCHPNKADALLAALIAAGKVVETPEGNLLNRKVDATLTARRQTGHQRSTAGRLGGVASGEAKRKALKNKEEPEAFALKAESRGEESRVEKNIESGARAPAKVSKPRASTLPPEIEPLHKSYFDRAKDLKLGNGQVAQLLKAHGFHKPGASVEEMRAALQRARANIESAAAAKVPVRYLASIINRLGDTEARFAGVDYDGAF